jgi:hypothetical protein
MPALDIDIKLEAIGSIYDIVFNGSDIEIAEDIVVTNQRFLIEFSTNIQEWFYDVNLGLPWLTDFFGESANRVTSNAFVIAGLNSITGVNSIISGPTFNLDDNRLSDLTVEVGTIYGSTILELGAIE